MATATLAAGIEILSVRGDMAHVTIKGQGYTFYRDGHGFRVEKWLDPSEGDSFVEWVDLPRETYGVTMNGVHATGCTCKHAQYRKAFCKHQEAAEMVMEV